MTVVDTLTTLTCVPATPVATLAPGGTVTCTGTYVVTQADIDNNGNPNPDGFIHNVATGDSDDTDPQDSFTDTPIAGSATSSTLKTVESVLNADDNSTPTESSTRPATRSTTRSCSPTPAPRRCTA